MKLGKLKPKMGKFGDFGDKWPIWSKFIASVTILSSNFYDKQIKH